VRATSSDSSSTTQLFSINVLAANYAPVLVNNELTIIEGQTVTISNSDLSATDVDHPDASLVFHVSGVSGGRFALAASPNVAIATFTQTQITAGQIVFVDNGDEIAPDYSVSVTDGDMSDGPSAATVVFVNANDAPTVGDATLAAISEDDVNPPGADVNSLFGTTFSDPDAGDALAGIVIIGNTADPITQGIWQYSSDSVTWSNIGTVDDSGNGLVVKADSLLRFVPAADFSGAPSDLLMRGLDSSYAGAFSVTAGSETRETIDTSSPAPSSPYSTATSALKTSVNPFNDAPTLASHSITVPSATIFTSSAGVFASLSGDVDGDALTAAFVTAPSHGSFVLAANGSFVYTPAAGFVGTDSFVWRSFDGTSFSADATVTITVKPGAAITPATPDPDPDPSPDPDPDSLPDPDPTPDPDPEPDSNPDDDGGGGGTSGPSVPDSSAPTIVPADVLLPFLDQENDDGVLIFDLLGHRHLAADGFDDLPESESNRVLLEQLRRNSRRGSDPTVSQMDVALMMAPGAMWTQMDATRDELESQIQGDLIVVGAAGAAASGFTVGFVAWAIRSGFLVSGLLAQLPAWRSIDPLLIMQGFGDSEDEETLEELMQRESESLD
jgi:hypothetical protein